MISSPIATEGPQAKQVTARPASGWNPAPVSEVTNDNLLRHR